MTRVRVPAFLRADIGLDAVVDVPTGAVADVIAALDERGPGVAIRLLDEAGLRRGVNVYVGSADIRYGAGLATPVATDDIVTILPTA